MFCIFWSASRGSRQALLRGGQFCSKITEGGRVRISWALYLSVRTLKFKISLYEKVGQLCCKITEGREGGGELGFVFFRITC